MLVDVHYDIVDSTQYRLSLWSFFLFVEFDAQILSKKPALTRTRPHLIINTGDQATDCLPMRLAYKFGMHRRPCLSRLLHPGSFGRSYTARSDPNYKLNFLPVGLSVPKLARRTFMSATMTVTLPTVRPLQPPKGSDLDFGAQIDGIDLENLTGLCNRRTYAPVPIADTF
jgi:hypothetical protein